MIRATGRPITGIVFILTVFLGIVCGMLFGYLGLNISETEDHALLQKEFGESHNFYLNTVIDHKYFEPDVDAYLNNENEVIEADELTAKVRVLCWIPTKPNNNKAQHIKATWGSRINILLFMSSKHVPQVPTIILKIVENRNHLWEKTKAGFSYVYTHYYNQSDWFMKADDDTYVIVENLKYLLADFNSSEPLYFGCRFKGKRSDYMSGGAGYVLSKEALRRFVVEGIPNATKCRQTGGGAEDVEIGRCLNRSGVQIMDTRDSLGRERFFSFIPQNNLIPGHTNPNHWIWNLLYYKFQEGNQCCSDAAITFHYTDPQMMYLIEQIIYHLRPYGLNRIVHHQHKARRIDQRINPATIVPSDKKATHGKKKKSKNQ